MVVHGAENVKKAQRGVFNKIKEKTMDNITVFLNHKNNSVHIVQFFPVFVLTKQRKKHYDMSMKQLF